MSRPAPSRVPRVLRAGGASLTAVLVTLAAHVAGGGEAPPATLVVAVLAVAWPVAVLLIGARPRLWRQAVVIGVAQLLLHAVFAAGAAGSPGMRTTAMPGMSGAHLDATAPMTGHAGTSMWLWHAIAWVLTVAAWHRGERALRGLLELLPRPALLAALQPVDLPTRPGRTALPAVPPIPLPVQLAGRPRRGPPLAV